MPNPVDTKFIKTSKVRAYCNFKGKRVSPDFLHALDAHVRQKLSVACSVHNGGRVTLDAAVAGFVGMGSTGVTR